MRILGYLTLALIVANLFVGFYDLVKHEAEIACVCILLAITLSFVALAYYLVV